MKATYDEIKYFRHSFAERNLNSRVKRDSFLQRNDANLLL